MLSPHEIAALVLVCEESKPRDLDMADIEALLCLLYTSDAADERG